MANYLRLFATSFVQTKFEEWRNLPRMAFVNALMEL